MKKSELKELIKAGIMAEVQNEVSEQMGQSKKGDKIKYDGEKHLIINILNDGSPVLVPMSVIDDEAFAVDSDEVDSSKLHSKVKYDGEKHLIVNILKDGSPVLVPMSVLDDESFAVDSDEIEESKLMAELQYDIDDTNSDYDFLSEEEDVEVDDEEIETTDIEMVSKVDPNVEAVQDALTAAQAAAQALGDEKLTDQIGNTITFFTRQHVSNVDSMDEIGIKENLNESRNRMLKLAGVIK